MVTFLLLLLSSCVACDDLCVEMCVETLDGMSPKYCKCMCDNGTGLPPPELTYYHEPKSREISFTFYDWKYSDWHPIPGERFIYDDGNGSDLSPWTSKRSEIEFDYYPKKIRCTSCETGASTNTTVGKQNEYDIHDPVFFHLTKHQPVEFQYTSLIEKYLKNIYTLFGNNPVAPCIKHSDFGTLDITTN